MMRVEVPIMSFRMRMASLPEVMASYLPLSFATVRRDARQVERVFNPVLASTVGAELEYGSLFAYLFRRFGCPLHGWNGTAELCRYVLTTPRVDLFLSVVPRIDGRTDLGLSFLGPAPLAQAAEEYLHAGLRHWEERALAHQSRLGMPAWLRKRALARCGTAPMPTVGSRADLQMWRAVLQLEPGGAAPVKRRAQSFLDRCQAAYAQVEAPPAPQVRPQALGDWDEADPLKPYALAAVRTLVSLKREVRVGDVAIDVFGARAGTARPLAAAPSAGQPCSEPRWRQPGGTVPPRESGAPDLQR